MNIYLEPGSYKLLNVGDAAMQIAAAERLRDFWANARISATTEDADRLARLCPQTAPVCAASRRRFFSDKIFGERLDKLLPAAVARKIKNLAPFARRRNPDFINSVKNRKSGAEAIKADFWTTLKSSDLVVVSGAGGLSDAFGVHAQTILETLDLAHRRRIPTVLFGQGIGPIKDARLAAQARRVLLQVALIAVRESRKGVELLKSFGVAAEKILVTGDDAVETAYNARKNSVGDLLGVNFRVAGYSKVEMNEVAAVAGTLEKIARQYRTELLPIPISFQAGTRSDIAVLQTLAAVKTVDYESDAHQTPAFVIEQISRCRVVVTGSYHAAVFALAQGIPVVCVAKTEYYLDKFYGLAEQFKVGCRVVSGEKNFNSEDLKEAVEKMWREAEALKEPLLEQARRQIGAGRAAYRKMYELIAAPEPKANDRRLQIAEQN